MHLWEEGNPLQNVMAQWQLFMEVHENLRERQKINGTQIFRKKEWKKEGKKEKKDEGKEERRRKEGRGKKKSVTGNYNPLNLILIHSKIMKQLLKLCIYLGDNKIGSLQWWDGAAQALFHSFTAFFRRLAKLVAEGNLPHW